MRRPTVSTNYIRHKLGNLVQSAALVLALLALAGGAAFLVWGDLGFWVALAATFFALVLSPSIAPSLVLSLYRARRLRRAECPELFAIVDSLARRAGLPAVPDLHYVASSQLNALSVGVPEHGAIAVTDGLLRRLSRRELAGVVAHELSHLRNRDSVVIGFSELLSRLVAFLSFSGVVLAGLVWLLSRQPPTGDVLVFTGLLVALPRASTLLQLALSRTREFDADADAVRLTGDPAGLAAALQRLAYLQRGWPFSGWTLRRSVAPSLLCTHPSTEERIERLRALGDSTPLPAGPAGHFGQGFDAIPHAGRWRGGGLWY